MNTISNNSNNTVLSKLLLSTNNKKLHTELKRISSSLSKKSTQLINGITTDGITNSIPISLIGNSTEKYKLLKQFILLKANINKFGIDGYTLLKRELCKPIGTIDVKFIFTICSKGADPNIPTCFPPIISFIKEMEGEMNDCMKINIKNKIRDIIRILICFGANVLQQDVYKKDAIDYAKKCNIPELWFSVSHMPFINVYTNPLLRCIANMYKINTKHIDLNDEKNKEFIITKINTHHTDKTIKFRNNSITNIHNPHTLSGTNIYELCNDEIVVYKLDKYTWCFHMNEIPNIILTGKNPWTGQLISDNIIEGMYNNLHYIPEFSLADIITNKYYSSCISKKNLFHYLSVFIHSFNCNVVMEKLNNMPKSELLQILKYSTEYHNVIDIIFSRGYSFPRDWFLKIIKLLQDNTLTVPKISYVCERFINLYDILQYIINIMGVELFSSLKQHIIFSSYVSIFELKTIIGEYYSLLILERFKISNYVNSNEDIEIEWIELMKMMIRHKD